MTGNLVSLISNQVIHIRQNYTVYINIHNITMESVSIKLTLCFEEKRKKHNGSNE